MVLDFETKKKHIRVGPFKHISNTLELGHNNDVYLGDDPCADGNGGCSEMCVPTIRGASCLCGAGKQLHEDGVSCQGFFHYNLLVVILC